ncbi:hypothetical protein [Yinghuangia sp. YIM S09857]|uniref:hypothetical protein n=1 Tax=Yinghuangia sp. YIM S09857 TaxID=3436929 RepID=UPI003F53CB5E
MTAAYFNDAAEKALADLSDTERAAVEAVRQVLSVEPRTGERRPSYHPETEQYVVQLTADDTGGREIGVLYHYHPGHDACLTTWIVAGP